MAIPGPVLDALTSLRGRALHALQVTRVPGWATPVAFASFGMFLVQSLDHLYVFSNVHLTLIEVTALCLVFAGLYLALAYGDHRLTPARRRLITTGLILFLAGNTVVHMVMLVPHLTARERYGIDAAASTDCATQMVLQGQDPYTNVHMLTCLNKHGLQFDQTTPKRAGAFWIFSTYPAPNSALFDNLLYRKYFQELAREEKDPNYASPLFEARFNYPGGALMLNLVAWVLGVRDLVGVCLGAALAASLLIFRRARSGMKWAIGLLLLGDTPLFIDSSYGATDVIYALLLVVYWQLRERVVLAGLVLGLAAATRQNVWFFIPFLLYLAWRTGGWRDVRVRAGCAVAVFLVCNVPFIVENPESWVAGIVGPMADPLFAQGVGLIALMIAIFKQHLGSPLIYLALEIVAYIAMFRFYMRRCLAAPGLALLLPLVPLFFAWRSLHTYFLVLPLLAMAVLTEYDARSARRTSGSRTDLELVA